MFREGLARARRRRFWWYEKEKKKKRWLDRSVALHSAIPDHWQPEPNATRVRVQVLSPFKLSIRPQFVTFCHPTNLPDLFRRLGRFSQSGQEAWMIMTARMYTCYCMSHLISSFAQECALKGSNIQHDIHYRAKRRILVVNQTCII